VTAAIDLTWIAGRVQQHQPHGWALLGAVVAFVLLSALVGALIGDAD
jgi:thiosulfate reductase cytochrome b subunit